MCSQRRLWSAWASAQSDQSLRCPHEECSSPELPIKRWVPMPFCWFCHEAAHMWNYFPTMVYLPLITPIMSGWGIADLICNDCSYNAWNTQHICDVPRENLPLGLSYQLRLKPECSASEATKSLRILDIETIGITLPRQPITKVLIRLCRCADWSAPLLLLYGIHRLCHDLTHLFSIQCHN